MELVTGAVARLLPNLGHRIVGEYKQQHGVKEKIRFLEAELESMQAALEMISVAPANQIDKQNKIWARDVRELSYDIEDCIDKFMVGLSLSTHSKDREPVEVHVFKIFVHKCCDLFSKFRIRHNIATETRKIKRHIMEVCERRDRYKIDNVVAKPIRVSIDPRLLVQYKDAKELVGIKEARDELIQILTEGVEVSMPQSKIVSIVGFGGLGKTTLANAVYEKISSQFDCQAFVSVSQTPDVKKLFKGILYELGKATINDEIIDEQYLINELWQYLYEKRYFIVIDDIWDASVWEIIKCALPDNRCGYRIVTTTRIFNVAEHIGGPYKMKPLSLDNSKILLYSRIFGSKEKDNNDSKEKYPDEELAEVSHKILKKCAGVPLAINTIASLLASKRRGKMEWYEVCNSIGTGLENSLDAENMRKILSFSYYDLPSHLRTCLLYLSVFPEDYKIGKDRLIRMWIAEGFIRGEKQEKSLFELGESYFHELINRSMIQPFYDNYTTMVEQCCLHDMVLDLIHSFSSEEKFISTLTNMDHISPLERVRRLCVQYGKVDLSGTHQYGKVRSLVSIHSTVIQMKCVRKFRVLRVLDLPGCDLSQCFSLKHIGKLCHLRYLGLRCTRITELPKAIGNLVLLETLDVTANYVHTLPPTVLCLWNLTSLHIDGWTQVPKSFGKLRSLEQLSRFAINNAHNMKELGHLTELKDLCILSGTGWNDCSEKSLVESLNKLQKIQTLSFWASDGSGSGNLDAWVAPQHIRKLELMGCWFSMLPSWVNPSLLLDLSFLSIGVRNLHQHDLNILGELPALRYLNLNVAQDNPRIHKLFFIGPYSFPCLIRCLLRGFGGSVVFEQGAMPKVTSIELTVPLRSAKEIAHGLGKLPSLQDVTICFNNTGTGQLEADVLIDATEMHPNRPTIEIKCPL